MKNSEILMFFTAICLLVKTVTLAGDVNLDYSDNHYVFTWTGDETVKVYVPKNEQQGIFGQDQGPDIRVNVDGTDLSFNGFVTPKLSTPTKSTYVMEEAEKSLMISHNNGLTVKVYMKPDNKTLYFQMNNSNTNTEIGMGPLIDSTVKKLYVNFGYVLNNDNGTLKGTLSHKGWEQLDSKFVGTDLSSGISMIQSEDFMPNRLEIANDKVSLVTVLKQPCLKFIFTRKGIQEGVDQYCREVFANNPRLSNEGYIEQVRKLFGRTWLGLWTPTQFKKWKRQLEEVISFGLDGDLAVLIHKWQRYGYDVKFPEMFPANPDLGGNAALLKVRNLCRENDVLFGMHENYTDYSYEAPSYTPEDAIQVNGKFVRRNLPNYHLLMPDRIPKYAKPNAQRIKAVFEPTLTFVDAFDTPMDAFFYQKDSTGLLRSYVYHDKAGSQFTVDDAEISVLEAYSAISEYYDAPMIAEDGGEWSIGYAHGAEVNMRDPNFGEITGYSDWEFYPWMSPVYRHVYNFLGVGYEGRYNYDRYGAGLLWTDDYRSTMLLVGHNTTGYAVAASGHGESDVWVEKLVKRHYMFYDFSKKTAGLEITNVAFNGDNIHQQIVNYSDGTKVHVNRGDSNWNVKGHELQQYGFLVIGPDGSFKSYSALLNGKKIDYTKSDLGEYLNGYQIETSVGNISSKGCAVRVDYKKKWTPDAKTDPTIKVIRFLDADGAERFNVSGREGFVYCKKLPFEIVPKTKEVEVKDVQYDEFIVNYTLDNYSGVVSTKIRDGQFSIQAGSSYFVTDNGKTFKAIADTDRTLSFDIEMSGHYHEILIMPCL